MIRFSPTICSSEMMFGKISASPEAPGEPFDPVDGERDGAAAGPHAVTVARLASRTPAIAGDRNRGCMADRVPVDPGTGRRRGRGGDAAGTRGPPRGAALELADAFVSRPGGSVEGA